MLRAVQSNSIQRLFGRISIFNGEDAMSEEFTGLPVTDIENNLEEASATECEKIPDVSCSIDADITPVINYSLLRSGFPVLRSIEITNSGDTALEHLTLRLSASDDILVPVCREIDYISAGSKIIITDIKPEFNIPVFATVTEKLILNLSFDLLISNRIATGISRKISILAFDEWSGTGVSPEVLSAFCIPNHPCLAQVISRASQILGGWTQDPSFNAYQTQDPDRVLKQAAAIYEALVEQNIVYCVAPASFEEAGQRIRLADSVLEQKMGNCLDLSLCFCSCLEAVGLNPFIILKSDHAFAGVWLEEMTFPESIRYDSSAITKRMANGINELTVVECTLFTAGHNDSFESAVAAAAKHFTELEKIEYIIDIKRARMSGITPLPLRVRTENGYEIARETITSTLEKAAPSSISPAGLELNETGACFTRKTLWERKLLDLGLRNQLINLRMSKNLIPLLSNSIAALEDTLFDGGEFTVLPRPADFQISEADITFDKIHEIFPGSELLESEFKSRRLRSTMSETQLAGAIKELYRTAKSSMEENGANTLYIALGLLRWYETDKSVKPRYAPLVLVPIDMLRKSAAGGYTIRLRDDEPQMNITILEKLKQDFNIVINTLNTLPTDEHGIDLTTVFTIIRKAIMNQPRWDVLESSYLGIFTFSQFVMWNDIRNRSADLEKNKVVKSLVEQKLAWDAEPMEIGESVDVGDVLLPLSADASQAFAIKEAARGNSFVLHGPPGTGKSQTITALIANALAAGKRVLFVAEKMAALSVVEKRLNKLGIGDFCLELHSNKSRKRDVLDQLEAACSITKETSPEEFLRNAEKISKLRAELDKYGKALHKKQAGGLSCYDLINIYEENVSAPDSVTFDGAALSGLDASALDSCRETVNNLVFAGRTLGHPSGHPLARIKKAEYSHSLDTRLIELAEAYRTALSAFRDKVTALSSACGIAEPVTYADIQNFSDVIVILKSWLNYPRIWAQQENPGSYFNSLLALCDSFSKQYDEYNILLTKWNESFFTCDPGSLLNEYREAQGAFLFMKGIKMNSLVRKLSSCSKIGINRETLSDELTALLNYKKLENSNNMQLQSYHEALLELPHGNEAEWSALRTTVKNAQNAAQKLEALLPSPEFRKNCLGNRSLSVQINDAFNSFDAMKAAQTALYSEGRIAAPASDSAFFESEAALCDNIAANTDSLKDVCLWNSFAETAAGYGIGNIVEAYTGGLDHDMVVPVYLKALSNSLISYIVDNDEYLKSFSDALFNDKIRQFKELDERVMELTKKEIYAKLAANVPNFQASSAQSSETGILQRAIKSNGRGTSIRKLFSQIPNLLPRLTPCMLMSPLSAAQYLDPASELFDLVVFDEASQLPTAKAVGAIARGREAVIVGDPNQMPPTSFFMSDSIDEENLDTEDLESILDDCLALDLPQTHLLWHYRSRHESLIAFSNSEFYENRLYTFPSVNDRESKVSFVHVDGFFDRGKTRQNHAEAEAIVEEIRRRCYDKEAAGLSLGVVTFNISQSNLIDDLIMNACREDSVLEDWLFNQEEPLFIKNLENVQGDERDVILFSVGYGTDRDGKTYMNFGPLNRDGGWRRLNVAVSRARYEMKVFSSLTAEQINLARTSSQGVSALKAFLEYAQNGTLRNRANSVTAQKPDAQGTISSICKLLEENGYKTATNIGHSAYRIDIGIIDPKDESRYLLGILIDGRSYREAQTTRDRELSQISVLEGLGWNITRIWSIGWWDNRKQELDILLKRLKELESSGNETVISGANTIKAVPVEKEKQIIETACVTEERTVADNKNEYVIRKFVAAALPVTPLSAEDFMAKGNVKEIQKRIDEILTVEAPITQDNLCKRLLASFDIPRCTAKLQEYISSLLDPGKYLITLGNTKFVWSSSVTPRNIDFFRTAEPNSPDRRDIKDIPIEEILQAAYYVVDCQISLTQEDLIREITKLFGFTRTGDAINSYISSGIQFALRNEKLKTDANGHITGTRNSN